MNPLISREIRSRWRDGRSFGLVFLVAAGLSFLFAWVYRDNLAYYAATENVPGRSALLGHMLFSQLAWVQTLGWLLVAPALTSSAIAYERERGWFDALILSPLLPRQISIGKWSGALLYAALLYAITLPCIALTLMLGGIAPEQFWLIVALHALCAAYGASVGLATSSWSYRSNVALRSAYGLILIWILSSLAGAVWAGQTGAARFASLFSSQAPPFWEFLGRTNPALCAVEITSSSPIQNWPLCFSLLAAGTVFFLGIATYFARKPLEEAPFVEVKRKSKKGAELLATHGEIPLVSKLWFANPVLNREVHSKFRMRQPPLMVIVVEIILGVLVAGFYLQTLYWAWFVPQNRIRIWFGMIITGLIVTMMASAVMGSNGFSREREAGTWEGLRLSLLTAKEILSGKLVGSLLTNLLFSIPVWPLILPCVAWIGASQATKFPVLPRHAVACALVWLATVCSFTMVGLWIGRKQNRSSRASGQTLGALGAFVIISPFLFAFTSKAMYILGAIHPFVAMALTFNPNADAKIFAWGLPFTLVHLLFCALMWFQLNRAVSRDMNRED